jgi:hypothetical protein
MDSKMFHQRARDCLRLADECPDLYAREALMELAAEFSHMANLVEADDAQTRWRSIVEDAAAHR